MSTLKELIKRKFSVEHLNQLYVEKIQHNATPGLDKLNVSNFKVDEQLSIISRKVIAGNYRFTPYKEKLISKGRQKYPRIISIPTLRDKVTLAALNEILTLKFSKKLVNKISTKIVQELKDAILSNKFDYFIKIDIKSFYDSIDQEILLSKINKKIKNRELIDLITSSIKNPTVSATAKKYQLNTGGVPQGISISNILANLYLNEMDEKFSKYKNVQYFRYVDDILILCTQKNHKLLKKNIYNELQNKLKLRVNEKEDEGELVKGFDYLGYQFTKISAESYGFTVKDKNYNRLKESLIKIITSYKNHKNSELFIWDINLRVTGFIIDKTKYGWLFFYSQMDDISKLYELDWLIEKVCNDTKVDPFLFGNIKKFVRAYHEITKRKGKADYIPKLQNYSLEKKVYLLNHIFGFTKDQLDGKSDKEIHTLFKKKMYQSVKELEKDVQQTS